MLRLELRKFRPFRAFSQNTIPQSDRKAVATNNEVKLTPEKRLPLPLLPDDAVHRLKTKSFMLSLALKIHGGTSNAKNLWHVLVLIFHGGQLIGMNNERAPIKFQFLWRRL